MDRAKVVTKKEHKFHSSPLGIFVNGKGNPIPMKKDQWGYLSIFVSPTILEEGK